MPERTPVPMGATNESEQRQNVHVMEWRVSQLEKTVGDKLGEILIELRELKHHNDVRLDGLRKDLNDRITSLETDRAKAMGVGIVAKVLLGLCSTGILGVAFGLWQVLQRLPVE